MLPLHRRMKIASRRSSRGHGSGLCHRGWNLVDMSSNTLVLCVFWESAPGHRVRAGQLAVATNLLRIARRPTLLLPGCSLLMRKWLQRMLPARIHHVTPSMMRRRAEVWLGPGGVGDKLRWLSAWRNDARASAPILKETILSP